MSRSVPLRSVLYAAALIVVASAPAILGLKWSTYWNQWIWFPAWPNAFDLALLILSSILCFSYVLPAIRRIIFQ